MNRQTQEFLGFLFILAIVVGIIVYTISKVQDFTNAHNWMHLIFTVIWLGIATLMFFLTRNDIRARNLQWTSGWVNLWKPVVGIITFWWTIDQVWKSLLAYPWLIFIPFGLVTLSIIMIVIRYFTSRSNVGKNP